MSARRWVEFLVPDALAMQLDWVRDLLKGDDTLLAQVARSPTARRLLTRGAHQRLHITVPSKGSLAPHQQWLLYAHPQQVLLARNLGTEALHDFIRTTVEARSVAILKEALGEDGYRRAVSGPGLPTEGLDRSQFEEALKRGRLTEYITGVGIALLETTTLAGDPFCQMRMRFAFSPACWRARSRGVRVEDAQLHARITELGTE
jgi:hypothetical protein